MLVYSINTVISARANALLWFFYDIIVIYADEIKRRGAAAAVLIFQLRGIFFTLLSILMIYAYLNRISYVDSLAAIINPESRGYYIFLSIISRGK